MEKSFLVKKFYRTLVSQARTIFGDAKVQTERWIQAVTMPLETQIKDHKQLLQSRLDNLAKINEKTTSINDQMAELKKVEADLQKQRDMIEGLIGRVSAQEAKAPIPDMVGTPMPRPDATISPELMRTTTRMTSLDAGAAEAEQAKSTAMPKPAPKPAPEPMVPDDLLAELGRMESAPTETQRLAGFTIPPAKQRVPSDGGPVTQPMAPEPAERTQRLSDPESTTTQRIAADPPEEQVRTQRLSSPDGDRTVKVSKLDPNWRPEPEPLPTPGTSAKDPTTTQRLDDSIRKLQEAKQLLQNLNN
jgi:hypothetical protein